MYCQFCVFFPARSLVQLIMCWLDCFCYSCSVCGTGCNEFIFVWCCVYYLKYFIFSVYCLYYRLKWMCLCFCDVLFHSVCMVFLLILLVNISLQVDMSVFVSFVLFQCVVFVLPIESTEWFSLAYCYLVLLLVKCLSQHQFDWKTIQEKQLERVRYTQVWQT